MTSTLLPSPPPQDTSPVGQTIPANLHLEFIRSVADTGNDPGTGAATVESFHRSLFLQQHGTDLERCRQDRRSREEHLADLEARLRHTRSRLEGIDPCLPILEDGLPDTLPNPPWNAWSRTMFVTCALALITLLAFGVFNVSYNLLESGIVTFAEHPIRAYLWAALLPVGALAVKIGWDLLPPRSRRRDAYVGSCLVLGLAGVLAWIATYATIYPNLSRTTAEQIEALSVFDSPAPNASSPTPSSPHAKTVDTILVASQAIAEIFLSAVLGIYLTRLHARHRTVQLAGNPVFTRFHDECRTLETALASERQALAAAIGEEARLEHQLAVFVAYARSLFHREASTRRLRSHRKLALIEQAASNLRAHLEALDHTTPEPDPTPTPTPAPATPAPPAQAQAPTPAPAPMPTPPPANGTHPHPHPHTPNGSPTLTPSRP